jgi:hypothetical protein
MSWSNYDRWKTTDPNEGPECPECGDAVEGDKWEGACVNDECDYSYEYCPDYDDKDYDDYDYQDDYKF